ncbi:hypothetical protein [Wolbachia endosymbiont of Folsomia candida]|uniref:hypothetical protein n=1 Tax=Wolbachia endosymbiont of Folsomia candida TaxID=169402 RepID=UPI000B01A37D|nr:hypothetical protein [Wolbachia endosymbiont of Folsomia candida]APR97756.1 hypothetical protein ASM33_00135 [Wolbachia endosymbiont of Folsomia candida]
MNEIVKGIAIFGGMASIGIGCVAGIGAINGILGGCIASFIPGLSPLVVGGMIGLGGFTLLCLPFTVLRLSLSEKKIELASKTISAMAVSFGIGAGLVALGFTSPAAIGALTLLASLVVCISLDLLINKAVESFPSKESEQPDGSLSGGMRVDEGSHILHT